MSVITVLGEMSVITVLGESTTPCLTPEEIEAICHFAFHVHDHEARKPAQPIFWYRLSSKDLRKFLD